MSDFDPEIELQVWNSPRKLVFSDRSQLRDWATKELEFWNQFTPKAPAVAQHWPAQLTPFRTIIDLCSRAEALRPQFDKQLRMISDGRTMVAESPNFAAVQKLLDADPDTGAIFVAAVRSDAPTIFGTSTTGMSISALLTGVLPFATSESLVATNAERRLVNLQQKFDESLIALDVRKKELDYEFSELANNARQSSKDRNDEWNGQRDGFDRDWEKLKAVYDSELGLRAPTSYWNEREKKHRNIAIAYAAGFSVVVCAAIYFFVVAGLDHLLYPTTKEPISLILPVLLPAFAVVWILRILGRLLSENLKLMTDASERGTLVKTFLALMNDKTTGRSVVKDDDRILILHSLFRPSQVTSVDDSPPVHWFDVLVNRRNQQN